MKVRISGDIQGGAGMLATGRNMVNLTAGVNGIFNNSLYLRLGRELALGGSLTNYNSLFSHQITSLRVGYNNVVSEKFEIRAYTGFGFMQAIRTTNEIDKDFETANLIASSIGGSVERRYLQEDYNTFSFPFGLDFHLHSKSVGFLFGFYFNASEYSEMGLRLGISFGKLRP